MKSVKVSLGKRSYPILIGKGLLRRLGFFLSQIQVGKKVLVVANRQVAEKIGFLKVVKKSVLSAGFSFNFYKLPYGTERDKSKEGLFRLWHAMGKAGLDRRSILVALGGGVTGDLAGFAASTYMRGIPLVHIPTTLLAQVDSAIGGKTAIDLEGAKNAVGTFYEPRFVLADLETLAHLPSTAFRHSFSEIIKYGVIEDPALFELLERQGSTFLKKAGRYSWDVGSYRFLEEIVLRCARIKARVVERDECEMSGERMILNYGHTFAHALEGASCYRMVHGVAVAFGMMLAASFSEKLGLTGKTFATRQAELIRELCGVHSLAPYAKRYRLNWLKIKSLFFRDKKTVSGSVRFVLPLKLGAVKVVPVREIDWHEIRSCFRQLGLETA